MLAEDITTESGAILSSPSFEISLPPVSTLASVVLSEVMWMGSDVSTADEWVEIAGFAPSGIDSSPQSLSGWTLSALKGAAETILVRFPAGSSIGSGQYLIVSNYTKEVSRIALDPYLTSTAMSLANTKLLLRLRDASGALIDEVDDGVGDPFAGLNPSSNGPKASMERIDLRQVGTMVSNWRSATLSRGFDPGTPIYGTPGFSSFIENETVSSQASSAQFSLQSLPSSSSNSSESITSFSSQNSSIFSLSSIQVQPLLSIKINELLSDSIGSDDGEWIEVFNAGNTPVNLSGMTVRVGTAGHRIRAGSGGFFIEPQHYLVLPKSIAGFTLTNGGNSVRLESGTTLLDTFSYPSYPEGVSAGRNDANDVVPFCIPTPGSMNTITNPEPHIVIQSGTPVGLDPVTLNLSVDVGSGSLASSTCSFNYSDGYVSDSCNPASHTMRIKGDYTIQMNFKNYCGTTVTRSLTGTVLVKNEIQHTALTHTKQLSQACTPSAFSGVELTEVLPNPTGEEKDGEWMEIHNSTEDSKSLCGWSLDDGLNGSRPYSLAAYQLPSKGYLALERRKTNITLNNDHDLVRLIAPLPEGGTGVWMNMQFNHAPDDQSFAKSGSGSWMWTPYLTPGSENRFQEAARAFLPASISITAALPNPQGPDTYDEWIELSNSAGWPIWLNGWVIRNKSGKELDLRGTVLAKFETKRIYISRLKYVLGNEEETLSLVDPDHKVRSILSWKGAKEDVEQKQFASTAPLKHALVRQVPDGQTLIVQMDGDPPDKLQTVNMLGISIPDQSSLPSISSLNFQRKEFIRALLLNKKIDLQFDSTIKNNEQMQRYVFLENTDIQQALLTRGLVYASRLEDVGRSAEYEVYEDMAKNLKIGLWADPETYAYYTEKIDADESWKDLQVYGLSLKVDVPEGVIASGALVHFTVNKPSSVYISVNNAPYSLLSGSYLVASNQTIRAYAEVALGDNPSIQSSTIEKTYIVDTDTPIGVIEISEVYPSPSKGETEWIELFNSSDDVVNMAGWSIDDTASGGSLPKMLTADSTINPHSYLLLPKSLTKLALNNGGDEVNLFTPSGDVADTMTYGALKTGWATAKNEESGTWCLTQKPTPLELNTCFIQNKKVVQKKSKNKGVKSNTTKINNKLDLPKDAVIDSGSYINLKSQLISNTNKKTVLGYGLGSKDIIIFMLFISLLSSLWFFYRKNAL